MASRADTNRIIDEVGRSIELVRGAGSRGDRIVRCGLDGAYTDGRTAPLDVRPTPTARRPARPQLPLSPIHRRPVDRPARRAHWRRCCRRRFPTPSHHAQTQDDNSTHTDTRARTARLLAEICKLSASDNHCSSAEQNATGDFCHSARMNRTDSTSVFSASKPTMTLLLTTSSC